MRPPRRSPRTQPDAVFIDSSAFYALIDPADARNSAAREIAKRLAAGRWQLFTTNFIRAEAHALILNRFSHLAADRFLQQLRENSGPTLIYVTKADEDQAQALIARYRDKDFSLTDATCFAVMERLGIPNAFTFDQNFTQYGQAVVLRP
jgi:uncharacterized protein